MKDSLGFPRIKVLHLAFSLFLLFGFENTLMAGEFITYVRFSNSQIENQQAIQVDLYQKDEYGVEAYGSSLGVIKQGTNAHGTATFFKRLRQALARSEFIEPKKILSVLKDEHTFTNLLNSSSVLKIVFSDRTAKDPGLIWMRNTGLTMDAIFTEPEYLHFNPPPKTYKFTRYLHRNPFLKSQLDLVVAGEQAKLILTQIDQEPMEFTFQKKQCRVFDIKKKWILCDITLGKEGVKFYLKLENGWFRLNWGPYQYATNPASIPEIVANGINVRLRAVED